MRAPRRILFLSVHYPPSAESGARRPWELVGALLDSGMRVTVVTSGSESGLETTRAHETIHRLQAPRAAARDVVAGSDPSGTTGTSRAHPPLGVRVAQIMPRLFHQYANFRSYPDFWQGITRRMVETGEAIDCDLVYSTAPPMSLHNAGDRLARRLGKPWIAEYRDHWADPASGAPAFSGSIMAPAATLMRRRIVRRPHCTVAVSEGISQWLAREGARRVVTARNGIPDRLLVGESSVARNGDVAHFGALYLHRSPTPFLDAIQALTLSNRLPKETAINFVGEAAQFAGRPVRELLEERGIHHLARFSPRIPHDEVLRQMRGAGVLLLLAQQQPLQVPNKLYEYLAARRPILAWVDKEGESARILQDVGGHFLVTEETSPAETVQVVLQALTAASHGWRPERPDALEKYRTSVQLQAVVEEIKRLVPR